MRIAYACSFLSSDIPFSIIAIRAWLVFISFRSTRMTGDRNSLVYTEMLFYRSLSTILETTAKILLPNNFH